VLAFMIFVFGAVPFIDAMIVRYVDDRMRSRVAGARLAVSFGVSSLAVYLLGPTVYEEVCEYCGLSAETIAAERLGCIASLQPKKPQPPKRRR